MNKDTLYIIGYKDEQGIVQKLFHSPNLELIRRRKSIMEQTYQRKLNIYKSIRKCYNTFNQEKGR